MVKIISDVPSELDESGADGLWDLAGELAEMAGLARGLEKPVYALNYGQEEIYNRLRELSEVTE